MPSTNRLFFNSSIALIHAANVSGSALTRAAANTASSPSGAGNTRTINDTTTKDTVGPALTIDALDLIGNGNRASYAFGGTCESGGGTVGFLVWGDPAFYDSTIRIVESMTRLGIDLELAVIPGISSIQLLAARHKIILNRVGQPIHVTTGRRLLDEYSSALGDVVVMLDGELTCAGLVKQFGDLVIYWGAQLGLPDEALIAGQLNKVIDEIRAKRVTIRNARGWVMDTYLLRPTSR